jgi:Vta1 like.
MQLFINHYLYNFVKLVFTGRLHALQKALKIDKSSDGAKMLLLKLMDWLEQEKKTHRDNDTIMNETAAQAYIENYALKLFQWADSMDRASTFNK